MTRGTSTGTTRPLAPVNMRTLMKAWSGRPQMTQQSPPSKFERPQTSYSERAAGLSRPETRGTEARIIASYLRRSGSRLKMETATSTGTTRGRTSRSTRIPTMGHDRTRLGIS